LEGVKFVSTYYEETLHLWPVDCNPKPINPNILQKNDYFYP